jgi:preprotein translocase subunit SecE
VASNDQTGEDTGASEESSEREPSQRDRTQSQEGASGGKKRRGGLLQFARECWAELQRVQWPGREQLWQSTAVVLVVCVVVATYLFVLDNYLFSQAAKWLIRQQAG